MKTTITLLATVLFYSTGFCLDWPQFKRTPDRLGWTPESVSVPSKLCAWVDFGSPLLAAPAVVGGRAYCMAENGLLACVELSENRVVWKRRLPGFNNESGPAVSGGKVYVGATNGLFYVLNATDGAVLKSYDAGAAIFASPLLLSSGVYFGSCNGLFHALDLSGNLKWVDTAALKVARAAAAQNGAIVYVDGDNHLRFIADSGSRSYLIRDTQFVQTEMTFPTALFGNNNTLTGFLCGPTLFNDTIYIGHSQAEMDGNNHALLSINAMTGRTFRRWAPEVGSTVYGGVSVDAVTGRVYWASANNGLQMNNGTWKTGPSYNVYPDGCFGVNTAPAVTATCVIFGTEQNIDTGGCALFFRNKSNGAQLWSYHPASHRALSTPVAVSDGRVLVGSMDGCLYGFWNGTERIAPVKVDSSGSAGLSGRSLMPGEWTLSLFPNPTAAQPVEILSNGTAQELAAVLYDAGGRELRRLSASTGSLFWDLKDSRGRTVAAGSYFIKVSSANHSIGRSFQVRVVR